MWEQGLNDPKVGSRVLRNRFGERVYSLVHKTLKTTHRDYITRYTTYIFIITYSTPLNICAIRVCGRKIISTVMVYGGSALICGGRKSNVVVNELQHSPLRINGGRACSPIGLEWCL